MNRFYVCELKVSFVSESEGSASLTWDAVFSMSSHFQSLWKEGWKVQHSKRPFRIADRHRIQERLPQSTTGCIGDCRWNGKSELYLVAGVNKDKGNKGVRALYCTLRRSELRGSGNPMSLFVWDLLVGGYSVFVGICCIRSIFSLMT